MKNSWTGSPDHIKQINEVRKLGNLKLKQQREQRIKEYNKKPKLCKNCGNILSYDEKNKTFCNSSCSASFTNIGKIKSKKEREKISQSLKGRPSKLKGQSKNFNENIKCIYEIIKICPVCKKEFMVHWQKRKQISCSIKCGRIHAITPEYREHMRQIQLKLVAEGKHQGWKARTKEPSYAEQYFIDLFKNEDITDWQREYKVDSYFIDFAFINKKIALEIDGKQHKLNEERINRDRKKDKILKEVGWKVIRIDWYNPINEKNRSKLYSQITEFKKEYYKY